MRKCIRVSFLHRLLPKRYGASPRGMRFVYLTIKMALDASYAIDYSSVDAEFHRDNHAGCQRKVKTCSAHIQSLFNQLIFIFKFQMTRSMSDQSLRRHVEDVRRKKDYSTGYFPNGDHEIENSDWAHTPEEESLLHEQMSLRLRFKHVSESNLAGLRSPTTPESSPSVRLPLPEFRPSESTLICANKDLL